MSGRTEESQGWIGRTLASQFRILEPLGSGGMGSVFLAEQLDVERRVVVKVMHPELAASAAAVERFKREAKAVARLNHPHIVQVFVFGHTDEGTLYLAMEYVNGESLSAVLRDGGRMGQARTLRIADQICQALTEAHAAGIVHRDLKPDNIMLTERMGNPDHVKVLDFGVAKLLEDPSEAKPSLTTTGHITGTPRYMSPEQARAKPLDARSDLYSLGLILYEMLCGEPPYTADSAVDYLVKHVTAPIPRPSERWTDLALLPRVESLVTKCLEKDPARRFQSAAELSREVRAALRDLPDGDRDFPTPGPAPRVAVGTREAATRSVVPVVLATAVLLAIAGGAVAWFLREAPVAPEPPVDPPRPLAVAPVKPGPAPEADPEPTPEAIAAPEPEAPDRVVAEPAKEPPKEPEIAAGGVFGEPLFPGAEVGMRTPTTAIYYARAPIRDVIVFYDQALGAKPHVQTFRGEADGKPMLSVTIDDPETKLRTLTVLLDPQVADGSRVMIATTSR